jgi:hypothetical protein
MSKDNKTWIVLGGSPKAKLYFDDVIAKHPNATTITCNCGLHLFFSHIAGPIYPDHYWISDLAACEIYSRFMNAAQERGTQIWTADRNEYGLSARGLKHADHYLPLPEQAEYTRGRYYHSKLSGTIITQIAINSGAEHVIWLGHDGYRSTPNNRVPDTFDGRMGTPNGWSNTCNIIAPFMNAVAEACPDVQFDYYGKPNYALEQPNVNVSKEVDGKAVRALLM